MRPLPSIFAFLTRFQAASMGALGLAALALALVAWQSDRTRREVSAARDVLISIEQVQKDLIDLETGVRGFVITGDDSYLDPYRAAHGRVLGDVQTLTERAPQIVPALRASGLPEVQTLTSYWLSLSAQEIAARRESAARAITLVQGGASKTVMDGLRAQLAEARTLASNDLTRRADMARTVSVSGGVVAGLMLLATLLILLIGRRLNRAMRALLVNATAAAETLGAGDLAARMPESPYQEGQSLAQSFNGMAEHLNGSLLQLQAANARLERSNRDLEQFAFAASHDLKTPLRTLTSFSELLQKRLGPGADERTRRDLGYIQQASRRMNDRVDALLRYARSQRDALNLSALDLGALLRELAAERLTPRGGSLTLHDLPRVRGDEKLLRMVFEQLFENALQHGGPALQLCAESHGRWCTLRLWDDGPGIPESYREQAFGLFQRVHAGGAREGSGVGLALCRTVVERHGGRIWLEDGPGGRGLAVAFTLPLA